MDGTPSDVPETDEITTWDAAAYLRKRVPQAQYARRSYDRIFYRNCLFFLGQQWLRFSRTAQQWKPIQVPDWFPKQVTNLFAVACDLMKSVFMQSDPQSVYTPASPDYADIAAARAASDISRFIEVDVDQSDLESKAATWLVVTGNAFVIDGYDSDPVHGTKFVADMMCLDCVRHIPAAEAEAGCPYCGGTNLMEARDENGEAIGEEVPTGKMFSEVCGPFEIHFDLVSGGIDKSPYVYRARTYPVEVLKQMFPDDADCIKPDDAGIDSGMFYQTALAYVTNGTTSTPGNYGGAVGSVDNVPRATLYHLWVRPTKNLPNGGEALIVGDKALWKSELVYHDEEGKPFVPLTHITFNTVAGRVFGKTPADDAVFKQVQLNKMEAFVQLHMERNANATWLLPKGIGVDAITGEPGEKIWYSSMLGAKPERVPGMELGGSVFRWLDSIAKAMQDITHTQDVMRGKSPEGVPTLGGAQLLLERGLAGYADGLKSWGRGWNNVRRNRLNIWREYCSTERTVMVLGKNQSWEAKKFTKADLAGHITCYLEEASIAPKSKAYDQLMISQMIDKQMLDLRDPAVRVAVFTKFDQPDLIEGLDIDIKDAIKEQEEAQQTGQWRPRPGIDNDEVHYLEHAKLCKSDEFKAWPPQMQVLAVQHTLYHKQEIQKAQEAASANDPHIMNAKAKMAQIQMELQGDAQQKAIELQHLKAKTDINLQAHGMRKGMDVALEARRRAAEAAQPQPVGAPQ
ncbi:MAG: hypothetical protein KGL39_25770 [Patescibacteria group bacterium]|nr:hypothetical protein [Patescibacteria group bacterium]